MSCPCCEPFKKRHLEANRRISTIDFANAGLYCLRLKCWTGLLLDNLGGFRLKAGGAVRIRGGREGTISLLGIMGTVASCLVL